MDELQEKPLIELEWEKFERGIVRPGGGGVSRAVGDPEVAARMAFVCGFQAACLVTRENDGDPDGRIWGDAFTAFMRERTEWMNRVRALSAEPK